MDLSCVENFSSSEASMTLERRGEGAYATADPGLDSNPRLIPNMLELEQMEGLPIDYFSQVQTDVQPFMRKVVTTWMLEVCEEQLCENQVFPLAVRYMDRFLCRRTISRQQLQLLAVVCLLIASKVRQCAPLAVNLLCAYTDHSVTADQVRQWELLVLGTLEWQTSSVTAFDLVDPLIARLCSPRGPLASLANLRYPSAHLIRRHAHTLVAVACTDTEFLWMYSSKVSGACVAAAARGLGAGLPGAGLIPAIAAMLHMSPTELRHIAERVELMLAREAGSAANATGNQTASGDCHTVPPLTPPGKMLPTSPRQPNTPTDLHDIHF